MKTLLRSLFIGSANDQPIQFLANYQKFLSSGLGFDVLEYNAIWDFIREFVRAHNHCPEITTLRAHFSQAKEHEVLNELEHLVVLQPLTKGDFDTVLNARADDRRMRLWTQILQEAATITQTGLTVKEGREQRVYKGPIDAARYLAEKSRDVVAPTMGGRLSGEVTKDGASVLREYETVESDPLAGLGQMSFVRQMDESLKGAKRYELWIHAAFTGGMKSTLMLNWAYSQAVIYKHNVLIFSLEMPYSQCRRILYSMHSLHPKFREVRMRLGLQANLDSDLGLPYSNIRDGSLNEWHPNAKRFFTDFVIPDFNGTEVVNHPDFKADYGKIHIEVADPDKSTFTVQDLRSMAEVIYSRSPFAMIFVDHCGLMSPRQQMKGTTENINEVIRDLKKLALGFNRGQGIAVVGLFQISREGYKSALKQKEKTGEAGYNLTHLSYANECLVAGTLIPTQKGFVEVEKIEVGDKVFDASGIKTVTHVFNQGVRPVWRTETDRGSVLLTTSNHRLRVVLDGSLGWKTVSEIQPGDYVLGRLGVPFTPENPVELPFLEVLKYEKSHGDQKIALKTPSTVTEDLAYLLGAWDGDGHIHPQGLSWTGNRKEASVKQKLMAAFEDTFGHTISCQEAPSRPGSFDLTKWSQPLKRWFEQVAGARAEVVPEAILRSPCVHAAYLKGLFDTDGWVNKVGIVGIKMQAKSEGFLRQVQLMLQGLGIDTYLSFGSDTLKMTDKTYYNLTLRIRSRQGRERFTSRVGFTEAHKHQRLLDFVGVGQASDRRGDIQMYPVKDTFLKAYARVHPLGSSRKGYSPGFLDAPRKIRLEGQVSKGNIEKLVQYARNNNLWDSDLEFLRALVEDHQVMQVVSVQPNGDEAPMWDLEVGGDHEYQTGALLSHNCERSADIVTAGWLDEEMRAQNRLKLMCLKARDHDLFTPFMVRVEWPTRRLLTCNDVLMTPEENAKLGGAVDVAHKEIDSGI